MHRRLEVDETFVPQKLAHVVLRSRSFDEAVGWYRTVLGAEAVFRNAVLCFLTYDDEHHRLAIVSDPGAEAPPERSSGMDHVAFTYGSLGELLSTYQRLKAVGILPVWCINHGPTTSLYYRDPDGNRVELQIDNFASEVELKAWFDTGAFARNPIGVEFDPDALVKRYENGEPIAELVLQQPA